MLNRKFLSPLTLTLEGPWSAGACSRFAAWRLAAAQGLEQGMEASFRALERRQAAALQTQTCFRGRGDALDL